MHRLKMTSQRLLDQNHAGLHQYHVPLPFGPIGVPYPKGLNCWFNALYNHYFFPINTPPNEFLVRTRQPPPPHLKPTFLRGWGVS